MRAIGSLSVPLVIILIAELVAFAVFAGPQSGGGLLVFALCLAATAYGFWWANRFTSKAQTKAA